MKNIFALMFTLLAALPSLAQFPTPPSPPSPPDPGEEIKLGDLQDQLDEIQAKINEIALSAKNIDGNVTVTATELRARAKSIDDNVLAAKNKIFSASENVESDVSDLKARVDKGFEHVSETLEAVDALIPTVRILGIFGAAALGIVAVGTVVMVPCVCLSGISSFINSIRTRKLAKYMVLRDAA